MKSNCGPEGIMGEVKIPNQVPTSIK
uniref:Uncharacterized protein n=1 Tax=Arundo donax TaxID=35708 RepID=A0A0A9H001_ARUDO